jgi:alpha-D-ribose 1-methylphosphonate 5-triphosphate synthase subunit PhnG
MAILAQSDGAVLAGLVAQAGLETACEILRGPETGLVTVRGRMGGGGDAFNVGEASVTRATIRLGNGAVGHSVMLGRDKAKAKLAAIVDAHACDEKGAALVDAAILAPLAAASGEADRKLREETAATRVDFFTMVRGED